MPSDVKQASSKSDESTPERRAFRCKARKLVRARGLLAISTARALLFASTTVPTNSSQGVRECVADCIYGYVRYGLALVVYQ